MKKRKHKSILKGPLGPFLLWLERYLGALVITLLGSTWRIRREFAPLPAQVAYATWHRNLVVMAHVFRRQRIGVMVSPSRDGELGAGPIAVLGFVPVRGSSSKSGFEAARELLHHAEHDSIGILPDGPKGPARVLKPGIVRLAAQAKLPLTGIGVIADRAWTLPTWDRMLIPKPFARVTVTLTEAIPIDGADNIEETVRKTQDLLDRINP